MGFVHHHDSADLGSIDVKKIAYTSTMELVLSHHGSRCICYQYSYMVVERRTTPLWPNNDRLAELVSNHMHTLQNAFKENWQLFCWRLWAYSKDSADLSSTHVKDIAHHSQ